MPKEYFVPDTKEPHIHVHKGGVTFTDIGHSHRTLENGDKTYTGTVSEVVATLNERGDDRSKLMVNWIEEHVG